MAASFCYYFFSFCVFTFFCVVEISYIKMSYTLFLISKIKISLFRYIFKTIMNIDEIEAGI